MDKRILVVLGIVLSVFSGAMCITLYHNNIYTIDTHSITGSDVEHEMLSHRFGMVMKTGSSHCEKVFCCPGPVGYAISTGAVLSGTPIGVDLFVWKPEEYRFRGIFVAEIIDLESRKVLLRRVIKWNELHVRPRHMSIRIPVTVENDSEFLIRVLALESGTVIDELESKVKVLKRRPVRASIAIEINYKVVSNRAEISRYIEKLKEMNGNTLPKDLKNLVIVILNVRIRNSDTKAVYIPATGCSCEIAAPMRVKVLRGKILRVDPNLICLPLCCRRLEPGTYLDDRPRVLLVQKPFAATIDVAVRICDVCDVRCSEITKSINIEVP